MRCCEYLSDGDGCGLTDASMHPRETMDRHGREVEVEDKGLKMVICSVENA
jgi:hypothetical protein